MAKLVCSAALFVFMLFWFKGGLSALENPGASGLSELPLIRNLSEQGFDSYGLPNGLAHKTVAGAVHHGMKEVEVWIQTLAPTAKTPIHPHECEEVVFVLKGYGTYYLSEGRDPEKPGKPLALHLYPNATYAVPMNAVHQVWNTHDVEDLQFVVTISRPPMELYMYKDWSVPHSEAALDEIIWNKIEEPEEKDEL